MQQEDDDDIRSVQRSHRDEKHNLTSWCDDDILRSKKEVLIVVELRKKDENHLFQKMYINYKYEYDWLLVCYFVLLEGTFWIR